MLAQNSLAILMPNDSINILVREVLYIVQIYTGMLREKTIT